MELQRLSESVYVGLCMKLGTPQQVAIRREVDDTVYLVDNKTFSRRPYKLIHMLSGSQGEGFRFQDSDMDLMFWNRGDLVYWDSSHIQFYNTRSYKMFLSDSSESPPGFTMLLLPLQDTPRSVPSGTHCGKINGVLYVSSEKYRNSKCSCKNFIPHGPCKSGRIGNTEFDHAHCLFSDFWPPIASSWVNRCHAWPSPNVVDDIKKSGCHVVPIGHKLGKHVNNEWRISFSMAEKKLVYSMNHTQFLTYGLLKLFLKEIINNGLDDKEKVLCSYHIKTVIFWAIQQNTMFDWCPKNLLEGFWVCFKLLLKWIYEGICPNFFIPENNMFLSNVYGDAQEILYTRMQSLYEMGIVFLLQIPSIRPYVTGLLCNPSLSTVTHENNLLSEVELDIYLSQKISAVNTLHHCDDLNVYLEYLEVVEQMLCSPNSEIQILVLQNLIVAILQSSAFLLHSVQFPLSCGNKDKYSRDKMLRNMLELAATFGCPTDLLYIAMYYYQTSRHREALTVVEVTKEKMAHGHGRCLCPKHQMIYREALGGQSWIFKMKHTTTKYVALNNYITYLDELILEQHSILQSENEFAKLKISPYVLIHMLEFFCCKQANTNRAQEALDALQYLVCHDWAVYMPRYCRKMSWQILGICQQMAGDHHAALHSYEQSLQQTSDMNTESATLLRIQDLHIS